MSYGIQTSRIVNGTTRISLDPQALGGRVFLGIIEVPYGTSQTYTYANVPGADKLRYYFINGGGHTISTSNQSGTGWAQITLTSYQTVRRPTGTRLLVFTTATTEPNYGILTTNDQGERTVSTQFPVPVFLGRVTMPAQPTYTNFIPEGSGTAYYHETATNLGLGYDKLILWTIPENGSNIYFTGDSYIPATTNPLITNYVIKGTVFATSSSASYTIGEALVFSLNTIPASTEGYGMQLFDSSGTLLFDASNDHLMIKGFGSISYTGTDTESVNENATIFSGTQPAVLVPAYTQISGQPRSGPGGGGLMSWLRTYEGGIRRQGTSIYAKRILTEANLEDANLDFIYTYGSNVNTIFGIDSSNLGAGGGTGGGPALGAYIQATGTEVTSCVYDSNSTSSCTISQSYYITTTGGNGNPLSYSWSLTDQSHSGAYVIDGSTTGSTVVVRTTRGDIGTSVTANLRCAVSQSGSNTANAVYPISRLHQSTSESVTITPSSLGWNTSSTISVNGSPSTTFTYQITNSNSQPTTFGGGPLSLNSSGNYSTTAFKGSDFGTPVGSKYLWVKFAATNNVKVANVTTTAVGPTINYFRVKAPGGSYSTSASGGYATTPYFEWSTTDATSVSVTDLASTALNAVDVQGSVRYTNRTYTLTATHISGGTSTASVTYSVSAPSIAISPTTLPNTKVNNSYNQTLTASGGRSGYTFAVTSGSLPTGLSLSGGVISGTPSTQGTFNFTITATDADGYTGSRSYSVSVDPANIIPTISYFDISLFSPESYGSSVSGGYGTTPKFRWSVSNASTVTISATGTVSGSNPANVASSGNGAPVLGAINNYGTTTITLTATSSTGDTASANVYFYGPSGPTITLSPSSLPGGYTGNSYSQTITASGGTDPYTYSIISGSAPTGVSLSSGGVLSGTPSVAGTYNFTVRATDDNYYTGSQSYSVTISSPPSITVSPTSLANGTQNTYYSESLSASGGTSPYSFSVISGSLPSGLSLSGSTISGTPSTSGTSYFTIQATDAVGFAGSRAYSITISSAVTYNEQLSTSPASPIANQNFNATVTGGVPNTTFSYTGSASGSGTLNSSGEFTFSNLNVPAGTYTYYFTFNGSGNSRTFQIVVSSPPPAGTVSMGFGGQTYYGYNQGPDSAVALYVQPDGTWNANDYAGVLGSGTWVTPATTAVAANYWIKFTRTSLFGGNAEGTSGWLQMNSVRTIWAITYSQYNLVQAQYTVQIATDSAGSNIVASTTVTLEAYAEGFL